jgi:hypothetical protein
VGDMTAFKEIIHPKTLWSCLVMASLFVFLWIFAEFTVKYFVYIKQSSPSVAEVFEWGVIEMDEDKFVVCADFKFQTNGTEEFVSSHLFEKTPFLSKSDAERFIASKQSEDWKCYWYGNPSDPSVSMERIFPLKVMVYSLIALAIFIYFSRLKEKFST